MINKLKFTIESNFDGSAIYRLYEGLNCSGTTVSYSGTTQVVGGVGNVEINNVDLNGDISIKIIDFGKCEACFNESIENEFICTPFTGTATYVPTVLYELNACDESRPPLLTAKNPQDVIGQRYILPTFPTQYYYTWGGVIKNVGVEQGSLIKLDGEIGCPT
jgi:hypothetical protein